MKTTLPENAPAEALHYIDSGFYHVSDETAGKLAKASARGALPRPGYEIPVTLADGRKAFLQRTVVSCFTWAPERQQVWAIHGIR